MITVMTFGTPHGHRATIMLEELELPYSIRKVDYAGGPVADPELRAVSPLGKFPTMIDTRHGSRRVIFGSGAILLHLARESGKLYPFNDVDGEAECLSWLMLGLTDLAPAMVGHFRFAVLAPEKQSFALDSYTSDVRNCLDALERRLAGSEWLAAGMYTVADIACFTFVDAARATEGLSEWPGLARWHERVAARPAVRRGMSQPS